MFFDTNHQCPSNTIAYPLRPDQKIETETERRKRGVTETERRKSGEREKRAKKEWEKTETERRKSGEREKQKQSEERV